MCIYIYLRIICTCAYVYMYIYDKMYAYCFLEASLQAKVLEERCTERDTSYDSPMKFEAWRVLRL